VSGAAGETRLVTKKIIRVMKFGGTSVGDAECMQRAAEIIAASASPVVVVVSAMSGVTNRLIAEARKSETGDSSASVELSAALRRQHAAAIAALVRDDDKRAQLATEINQIINEASDLCRGTALLRELTARALDAISGVGERLSARLVASALQ
jgi:aspartokinase/homoserine dehydrogenase 1